MAKLIPALALLAAAATLTAPAQQPWQHLQNPTAAEVLRTWNDAPSPYGPEPYYGLNGPFDLATVQRDLDTMHAMGFRAVTVQFGYGSNLTYLSPEYFAFFKQFVAEAKKRNMGIWIVDDAGYPSGFAGGKFTSEHPELRMQALVVTQHFTVKPGDTLKQTIEPDTAALSASNADQTLSIPFTGNTVTWTAPAGPGSWNVAVVKHIFSTSPTRSDTNPKRTKDGSQSLEDYLDPAATAQFLAFTHQQYKAAIGDEFGKTVLGFRGDEPDYSIAGLPWTPKFFATFERIKGYDIRAHLAAFTPPVHVTGQHDPGPAPLTPAQQRAKADYYDVFSQMFRDGFFKPQGVWCAANHLEYQVHLNHEEMEMQLTRSEGEFFRDMRFVEVPGIDSIWHQIWNDTVSDFPRLASSAAHVYGHPRAFTESFAAYRPAPDITLARYILNEQFVRGVNLVETMYFPATSTPSRGPAGPNGGAPYMRDPAWPALMAYTRRVSYLMSQGRPAADVALYLPSSSMWLGDANADKQFVSTERLLGDHQIDFDIVDEDFLAGTLQNPQTSQDPRTGCPMITGAAGEGYRADTPCPPTSLQTASGNTFHTVILPSPSILAQAALTRLQLFARNGGKVLILGQAPTLIAGRTILDARPSTPADFTLFQIVSADLPETPTPPAYPPPAPPAPMQVPENVLAALTPITAAEPVHLAQPTPALKLIRRHLADSDVLFLFNESAAPLTNTLVFPHPPAHADQWNAETGTSTPIDLKTPLQLAPYASTILVLHP